jgi:outer membrane protein TolC
VEIIPTDKPESPAAIEAASFEDAVKEALQKRPDVLEQAYNIKNAEVDIRATKNALLPTATLSLEYSSSGLAGNSFLTGTPGVAAGAPVVNGAGVAVPGFFIPEPVPNITGTSKEGLGTAQSQIFRNNFPLYAGQLTVSLPLRNRANQADNIHAQLVARQFEAQVQQIKNNAVLDVRNTTIALEQGRAQVQSASKARELQQQTFEAEQKKYQLGASTVYNVILTQRDLITAQGTELRALANLAEAKANYERALGRTLEVNNVTIAGAKKGVIDQDTLIPGTLNGQVVGTDSLFKQLEKAGLTGQR